MSIASYQTFECHLYIGQHDQLRFGLPIETGPRRVAQLKPAGHDALIDPVFRRLLVAFESVPRPLQTLQV